MSSFRSHVAATPTRILFALDESDNLQQVSDGTCKQSTSNAKIRRPIDENLSINGLNSSYSSYHHDIGASWLNATASTPSFHSIDLTTPTCGSKAVIMNNSDDKNDDSVVIMESDDSDESTQESEEDRIRREEEESIRLAQQLMMQDSMEVYEMQRNFLAQHSNLMNTDDWNAIQAIMNEPNAVHEPQTDNDMEYEDSGEMNYEQLLELGEILGGNQRFCGYFSHNILNTLSARQIMWQYHRILNRIIRNLIYNLLIL